LRDGFLIKLKIPEETTRRTPQKEEIREPGIEESKNPVFDFSWFHGFLLQIHNLAKDWGGNFQNPKKKVAKAAKLGLSGFQRHLT
jgi:hypothetical protein